MVRLWVIWPQLEMGRKFLTDQLPPSNAGLRVDCIQVVARRVEELEIIGTLNMPKFASLLYCGS